MKIAFTGITGNVGQEVLSEVMKLEGVEKIKLLVLPDDKRIKKLQKEYKGKTGNWEIILGNIGDKNICKKLVEGVDYVVNLAAVIPPHSDKFPRKAVECNELGVDNLVSVIESQKKQPKLIHFSTVALYGNRNSRHPYGRIGDPLLVSPFDIYSATKLRGEFRVLESKIEKWAVLRETAVLHKNMLSDNMSDGLMFHTCFNAPLEWVTAHDSGVLVANILKQDMQSDLGDKFWRKCFNIGGGNENRLTGFDTLNDGFKIIGGTCKDFFKPYYNSLRNFHGMWFYDSDVLDKMFDYQHQDTREYWKEVKKTHKIFQAGRVVPKYFIRKFVIDKLRKDSNAPKYWFDHKDTARLTAYFGSVGRYLAMPKKWKDFPLLIENKDEEGNAIDYAKLHDIKNAKLIDYGFDIDKDNVALKDLQNVAKMHGGELVSKKYGGNLYETLNWKTQDGETFSANAYTVLYCGHWFNPTYKKNVWDFDRLAKKDKIFAQIWRDSHDEKENHFYYFDEEFNAHMKTEGKQ